MCDNEQRYREALEKILARSYFRPASAVIYDITDLAQEALNPPPEFEEVEVFAAKIIYDSGTTIICSSVEAAEKEVERIKSIAIKNKRDYGSAYKYRIVELTGIDRVPKPKKVPRREEIEIHQPRLNVRTKSPNGFPSNARFFVEWLE